LFTTTLFLISDPTCFEKTNGEAGNFLKMAVFWVAVLCSITEIYRLIALMMEAASTSEMSVNLNQTTWSYNPEDSHLHTCRHEDLKSYLGNFFIYWELDNLENMPN
jgi:hypothetical protein